MNQKQTLAHIAKLIAHGEWGIAGYGIGDYWTSRRCGEFTQDHLDPVADMLRAIIDEHYEFVKRALLTRP